MYCLIKNSLNGNIIHLKQFNVQKHSSACFWKREFSVASKYDVLNSKQPKVLQKHSLYGLFECFCFGFQNHHQNRRPLIRLMCDIHKDRHLNDLPDGIFKGYLDRYNGVTVLSKEEYDPLSDFPTKLKKSLKYWRNHKRRCVWFQVDRNHSDWIPHLTNFDFDFHHCRDGCIMLYNWLAENEANNVPSYAHTMVGVGGLVINQHEQILVVTDRHAIIPNSLKLPGGMVEPREDIIQAAIREVFEETGIECVYSSVICLRHTHEMSFGLSDLYFVIGLTPLNSVIKIDQREIVHAEWLPLQKFLQHPKVHEGSRNLVKIYLANQKDGIKFQAQQLSHPILKKMYTLFSAHKASS